MLWLWLADTVVVIHMAFVVFVVAGGLLLFRWRWVVWLHVPAMVWGGFAEFANCACPLTRLERWLRTVAHVRATSGDFLQHYLFPFLYQALTTVQSHMLLGSLVFVINGVIYCIWLRRFSFHV